MIKLLDGADATGAGAAVIFRKVPSDFTLQVSTTGSPTSVVLDIEGSIDDGATWVQLAQHTVASNPDMFHISGKPVNRIRCNLTTLTGGTAPTVTVDMDFARVGDAGSYLI